MGRSDLAIGCDIEKFTLPVYEWRHTRKTTMLELCLRAFGWDLLLVYHYLLSPPVFLILSVGNANNYHFQTLISTPHFIIAQ
jgi:hypothetical protein